jgi:hypothetical protein
VEVVIGYEAEEFEHRALHRSQATSRRAPGISQQAQEEFAKVAPGLDPVALGTD